MVVLQAFVGLGKARYQPYLVGPGFQRPRDEASTAAPATGDQPAIEEVHVDPTVSLDSASDDDTTNPIVTSPLSLRAMMETFMTTQAAHGQLIDELLTKVAALKADFAEDRSTFPPPPPSDP
uniref:Uncharacterized protein n=1 Tax=Quercus lobata TaxID=97700 RepID=A0A7N2M2N4_QUELO